MKAKIKSVPLLHLFEKFIRDSRTGRRLQANGKKFTAGTIDNYKCCLRLLGDFSKEKSFELRVNISRRLSSRQTLTEKRYWQRFYRLFTSWMYDERGYYDNYTGMIIKNIKIFFNYLEKDLSLTIGNFYKQFYVRSETIAIHPLQPEQLNFLITNTEFEETLNRRLRQTKDFFIFGCTVALRFSDLISLKWINIRIIRNRHYLVVCSKKTGTESLVKLPAYAVDVINKYSKRRNKLLPKFNRTNLNYFVKRLGEKAGFTQPVFLTRSRRGIPIIQEPRPGKPTRFCDVITTHTMRRTGITTMLSLGMPEQIVRKISGHSPSSKEFYRYVSWAQAYQDIQADIVFDKLGELTAYDH